jgi:Lon protease-like protein
MKHSYPTLYLFNNVFFPQTVIPLTVSDGVSKDVLMECFDQNQPMVFYHPSTRAKKIGTIGKILILEHNADKSMTVLVQGIARVQLIIQVQHLPFPVYDVEDYFDAREESAILNNSIERLSDIMKSWLHRHISTPSERTRFLKEMVTPQKLINNLCLLVIKDVELKEILLASTSLTERIRMLDALLRGKAPEIEDDMMSEAIKNFERLEAQSNIKNAV